MKKISYIEILEKLSKLGHDENEGADTIFNGCNRLFEQKQKLLVIKRWIKMLKILPYLSATDIRVLSFQRHVLDNSNNPNLVKVVVNKKIIEILQNSTIFARTGFLTVHIWYTNNIFNFLSKKFRKRAEVVRNDYIYIEILKKVANLYTMKIRALLLFFQIYVKLKKNLN